MPRRERPLLRTLLNDQLYTHRADVLDAGWPADAIRDAVAAEGLIRLGRQWILAPEAAPELHAAAAGGAVVTCSTAAPLLHLWVLKKPTEHHLALPVSASRAPEGVHPHWSIGVVPRRPRALVDSIENVLQVAADCLPQEEAQTLFDSALRERLLTLEDLKAIDWRGSRARRCSEQATAASHSGLETLFATRMRRLGVEVRQQVKLAGRHVDALVGKRVVVQIDGYAHHSDAVQRRSDIAHDRALQRLGFIVLRFDYHEIVTEWPRVQATVMRALARGAR